MSSTTSAQAGPLGSLLRLFSSVWLGVCLLVALFVYSSVGSALVFVRQTRFMEMTEFEWFHWWPFDLLIALICVNITVATLRRIPFKPVNFGVLMIHTGIITLCVGSVIYFGRKVEGDAPITRRQVVLSTPDTQPVRMPAIPGNGVVVGNGAYRVDVSSVDPEWELLSGDDAGKKAFSVTLSIRTADRVFLRQVIADYPEYTEDLVRSEDSAQPFARAVKVLGEPIVDTTLSATLEYDPQPYFYLANNLRKSWALYVREKGTRAWIQRPVDGVPLYNDYIVSPSDVLLAPGEPPLEPDPLNVLVGAHEPGDPIPDLDLRITSYLRHAQLETRLLPGGDALNPVATVELANQSGLSRRYELAAFDPRRNSEEGQRLQFVWLNSEDERAMYRRTRPRSLVITIPDTDIEVVAPITETLGTNPDLNFTPVEGTPYAYRVRAVHDRLQISGREMSIAMVEVRSGDRSFLRWVFEDPAIARDHEIGGEQAHESPIPLDEGIAMVYDPGQRVAPVLLMGGPEPDRLGVQITLADREPRYHALQLGQAHDIDMGITLRVTSFVPFAQERTLPMIVPRERRDRDAKELFSMVKVEVPLGGTSRSVWVPFHHYPVESVNDTLRRFAYRPVTVDLPDGRAIEIVFSRQRQPLPTPVVLDDFAVASHVGGFTGRVSSIRDWTSVVRFAAEDGTWTDAQRVSVNAPVEHRDFWYFQAQWDPPMGPRFEGDPPSAGLNYTVLGVGNRHGVVVQLVGCTIAVIGMLFAFYVKPLIKRRRQQRVYASVASRTSTRRERPAASELVSVEKQA